jgi:hypothetical protein
LIEGGREGGRKEGREGGKEEHRGDIRLAALAKPLNPRKTPLTCLPLLAPLSHGAVLK